MDVRFDAVIFDLDGTLADTLQDIADAMNTALEQLGHPTHPIVDYRFMVGDGIENLARRALPAGRESEVHETVARFREHYSAHLVDRTRPFAGIPELLDALVERSLPVAVLSNKKDDMTRRIVDQCFARWSFAETFGERAGVPRKPDPAAALEIARKLGVAPQHCAFVGDTDVDMRTGVNAGMFPVGVLWGFRPEAELISSGARALIDTPQALLTLPGMPEPRAVR